MRGGSGFMMQVESYFRGERTGRRGDMQVGEPVI